MGQIDFLYGWYKSQEEILQKKEVIIVEGAKSVMKLYQYGYRNAVAALTSHLNEHQLLPLIKAGCDVVIALIRTQNPTMTIYQTIAPVLSTILCVRINQDSWEKKRMPPCRTKKAKRKIWIFQTI